MVGGDVGDHGDVVAGQPDPLEQDAAAGGLGHRELDVLVCQHPPRAARTGVVTRLDQLAVDVDAVGVRPAHQLAVGAARCGRSSGRSWSCRWCRSPRRPGPCGVIVCGPGPRRLGADPVRGLAHRRSTSAAGQVRRARRPRRLPIAWARSRWRHGNATTIWWASLVGRTRTASRVVPDSAATARTSRATARSANRCRNPDSAAPGRAFFRPIRLANRAARLVGRRRQRADVQGQLDRGPREVEVRSFQDAEFDEGEVTRDTLRRPARG